ncbi:hypothetical protein F5H01DRAFT_363544 [Linnemannia elongata]|nr:hypothetical protein F5H01DRAFT_363544 [Linnemannia elongata]
MWLDEELRAPQQHPSTGKICLDAEAEGSAAAAGGSVVEAVQEELKASDKDPALSEYLDPLYRIVTNFGVASTSKGDAHAPVLESQDTTQG